MEKGNKRTLKEDFSLIKRVINLINQVQPRFILHACIFNFCFEGARFSSNYITAAIVDELTGDRRIKILTILLSFYLIEVVLRVLRDYSWRKIRTFHIIAPKWEEKLLNAKSFEMDYRNTEDASVRAKRQMITDRAEKGGFEETAGQLINIIGGMWRFLLAFAISITLFFKHPDTVLTGGEKIIDSPLFTLLFFVLIGIISYLEYVINGKYYHKIVKSQQKRSLSQIHLHYYFDEYLDDSKAAKDVHIYKQKNLIFHSFNRFYDDWEKYSHEWYNNDRKRFNAHSILYLIITGLTYLYVALKIHIGAFGIGSFIKYQFSIARIMEGCFIISNSVTRLRANNDCLELFFEYLDMPSEMHYGTIPTEKRSDNIYDIEFHNVSFKYPHSDIYAIKNLSFKFKVGEKVAVVGMNGSGKTTMIKLLCRLYDPTEGYITLNGIDITKYDYEDYLALFSVVFQDFRLFSFSLGENVACTQNYDDDKVLSCLNIAGMKERVSSLTDGLKSVIYKDFDENGIEISGGEAQKIAIARALYKDAPFVILDEPTASLDPIAEYEIYSRFNDMVENKTAIYISHRLSSCRFCDKIAVFHEGEIIQFGSHEDLLKDTNGKYYELWNAQAQYYTDKTTA